MSATRREAIEDLAKYMHTADCASSDCGSEADPWYVELATSALEWFDDRGVRVEVR